MKSQSFAQMLKDLVVDFGGNKRQLAEAIGISPSQLSHLLAGNSVPSLEVCLRLAEVTGAPAINVLRAAHRNDIADLLGRLFGPPPRGRQQPYRTQLSASEQEHIIEWRKLPARVQRAHETLMSGLVEVFERARKAS